MAEAYAKAVTQDDFITPFDWMTRFWTLNGSFISDFVICSDREYIALASSNKWLCFYMQVSVCDLHFKFIVSLMY